MEILQIEQLITDPRFQLLKYKQEKTNIFTIVGQTHTEHWHSAFLAWLFDPHSSLRLGHFPLARLLTLYMIKKPDCGYHLKDIFDWNLDEVRFVTEKDASFDEVKKSSIDVYGESDELILVIENKVNAYENFNGTDKGQTDNYYRYAEKIKKSGQKTLYFFITADQNQKPYSEHYVHISYQEIFDFVISKCIEHPQVPKDGKYLLEQYASNLRETVRNTNKPMAMVNIKLCNALYHDHQTVFDEIFVKAENSTDPIEEPAYAVYEHYKDIFDEIFLSVDQYGKTPSMEIQRQGVESGLSQLHMQDGIHDGMLFHMKYDGVEYFARLNVTDDSHVYMQVLDENKEPYEDKLTHKQKGIFDNPETASVFAVNIRYKLQDSTRRVKDLQGKATWYDLQSGKNIASYMGDRI